MAESSKLAIPIAILDEVRLSLVPDYDGSDTGNVKIEFGPAVQGKGWVMLPVEMFSDDMQRRLKGAFPAIQADWREANGFSNG